MHCLNLFRDEQSDYRPEKKTVHSKIDPLLNEDFHFNYVNLNNQAISQKWYNQSIKTLYVMAGAKTTPPLCSQAQNSQTSQDIINARFVSAALQGRASQTSDVNLITNLRAALTEADFTREDIKECLSQFDPSMSINQYYSQHNNIHLIKSKGQFSSLEEGGSGSERGWVSLITFFFVNYR